MQERELIDLGLSRTKELGVGVAYNREKKKFFYDGAGFQQYLALAPQSGHAAEAEFALLSYQFYQSSGTDPAAVTAAAAAKQRFLTRFPKFKDNAELSLFLAVDYRDLHRHYRQAHDAANAEKYRLLTRRERGQLPVVPAGQMLVNVLDLGRHQVEVVEQPFRRRGHGFAAAHVVRQGLIGVAQDAGIVVKTGKKTAGSAAGIRLARSARMAPYCGTGR